MYLKMLARMGTRFKRLKIDFILEEISFLSMKIYSKIDNLELRDLVFLSQNAIEKETESFKKLVSRYNDKV